MTPWQAMSPDVVRWHEWFDGQNWGRQRAQRVVVAVRRVQRDVNTATAGARTQTLGALGHFASSDDVREYIEARDLPERPGRLARGRGLSKRLSEPTP